MGSSASRDAHITKEEEGDFWAVMHFKKIKDPHRTYARKKQAGQLGRYARPCLAAPRRAAPLSC